jgi:hypothetical protein
VLPDSLTPLPMQTTGDGPGDLAVTNFDALTLPLPSMRPGPELLKVQSAPMIWICSVARMLIELRVAFGVTAPA